MLRVRGLETFYGNSQALFGMHLDVPAGDAVALMGRNGMGKTTTIRTIMGLLQPVAGTVEIDGADMAGHAPHEIARAGLGYVPEGRQIFPNLTVHENLVATASDRRSATDPWNLDQVLEIFPGLKPRIHAMGNLLSGGEQQMLAIGRALMTNPKLLILDEATEGLAPLVRDQIWACLARIKNAGISILIVDKNVPDLMSLCDHAVMIAKGKVVWSGTSEELGNAPDVRQKYLGI
ncbi:MAG: ABC transporter ATP-binding protein [Methyloligellaceae bacterium]